MSVEDRISRLERYVQADAKRWYAAHARITALRIAIGAVFDTFRDAEGTATERLIGMLREIEEHARRTNENGAFVAELRVVRQLVAGEAQDPSNPANDR